MVKSGKAKEPTLNDVPSFRSLLRIFRHIKEATAPQSRCRRYHLVLVPLLSERPKSQVANRIAIVVESSAIYIYNTYIIRDARDEEHIYRISTSRSRMLRTAIKI